MPLLFKRLLIVIPGGVLYAFLICYINDYELSKAFLSNFIFFSISLYAGFLLLEYVDKRRNKRQK